MQIQFLWDVLEPDIFLLSNAAFSRFELVTEIHSSFEVKSCNPFRWDEVIIKGTGILRDIDFEESKEVFKVN